MKIAVTTRCIALGLWLAASPAWAAEPAPTARAAGPQPAPGLSLEAPAAAKIDPRQTRAAASERRAPQARMLQAPRNELQELAADAAKLRVKPHARTKIVTPQADAITPRTPVRIAPTSLSTLSPGAFLDAASAAREERSDGVQRARRETDTPAWLNVTIRTGDDDLRRASVAALELRSPELDGIPASKGGSSCTRFELNGNGNEWRANSTHTVRLRMCAAELQLRELCLSFESSSRIDFDELFPTGDNWDVDRLEVTYLSSDGRPTRILSDGGLRMTGRNGRQCFPIFAQTAGR